MIGGIVHEMLHNILYSPCRSRMILVSKVMSRRSKRHGDIVLIEFGRRAQVAMPQPFPATRYAPQRHIPGVRLLYAISSLPRSRNVLG